MSYKEFTNEPRFLWNYRTKVHEIFTRYRDIIYAVNAHIEVAITHCISRCQSDKCMGVGNIATKFFAMATSLEESKKTGTDREDLRQYLPFGEKNHENRSSRS